MGRVVIDGPGYPLAPAPSIDSIAAARGGEMRYTWRSHAEGPPPMNLLRLLRLSCPALVLALAGALSCPAVTRECPGYIRPAGNDACYLYDQASIDGCTSLFRQFTSCEDFALHPCLITASSLCDTGEGGAGGAPSSPGEAGNAGSAGESGSGGSAGSHLGSGGAAGTAAGAGGA